MSGFHVQVMREGRSETVDLAELSDTDLMAWASGEPPIRGWSYALRMARWIRDNVGRDVLDRSPRERPAIAELAKLVESVEPLELRCLDDREEYFCVLCRAEIAWGGHEPTCPWLALKAVVEKGASA